MNVRLQKLNNCVDDCYFCTIHLKCIKKKTKTFVLFILIMPLLLDCFYNEELPVPVLNGFAYNQKRFII